MDFVFRLGFHEELALLELSSVLGFVPKKLKPGEYQVNLPGLDDLNSLANRLGGLVEVTFGDTGKIVWKHSARSWFKRDRLKPFADARKGLLPPKVARMLVNIALGQNINQQTLLDPFCGSGTILLEAGLLGARVIGSDLDRKQLAGAEKNLKWAGLPVNLILADAVKISDFIKDPVDCIVTEPFMGRPNPTPAQIPNVARGLEKLYLGCFKNWQKILQPGGKIVIVLPLFQVGEKAVHTADVVDAPHFVGYNLVTRGIIYSRPGATVRREVVILQKQN